MEVKDRCHVLESCLYWLELVVAAIVIYGISFSLATEVWKSQDILLGSIPTGSRAYNSCSSSNTAIIFILFDLFVAVVEVTFKMKQRITFLQRPEDSIDPARLTVTEHSISTETVVAAREDSVTFSFEELPQEFLTLLEEVIDYHIRWTSETSYDVMPPLVGRTSPGLHAFYTPREASSNECVSRNPRLYNLTFPGLSLVKYSHNHLEHQTVYLVKYFITGLLLLQWIR